MYYPSFRCLSSESDAEKLQEKVTELRRRLDDTQAALQDLGRENQTLQVRFNDLKIVSLTVCNQHRCLVVRVYN